MSTEVSNNTQSTLQVRPAAGKNSPVGKAYVNLSEDALVVICSNAKQLLTPHRQIFGGVEVKLQPAGNQTAQVAVAPQIVRTTIKSPELDTASYTPGVRQTGSTLVTLFVLANNIDPTLAGLVRAAANEQKMIGETANV